MVVKHNNSLELLARIAISKNSGGGKSFTVHEKNSRQNLQVETVESFASSPGLESLSQNTSLRSSSLELQYDGTS